MSSRILLLIMFGLVVVMAGCKVEKRAPLPQAEIKMDPDEVEVNREFGRYMGEISTYYRRERYTGRKTAAFGGKVLKRWTLIEGECDMVRVTHGSMLFPMSGTIRVSYDEAFLFDPFHKKCQKGDSVQIRLVRTLDALPASTGVWEKIKHLVDEHTLVVVGDK